MTRLWSCGFELASSTNGMEFVPAGGTPSNVTIQTSPVRSGSRSANTVMLSSNAKALGYQWRASAGAVNVYFRTYFYINTLPVNTTKIIALSQSVSFAINSTAPSIKLTSSGTLQLFNGVTQIGSDSSALSTGTWYRIEMHYDSTPAGGSEVLEARVEGTNFASSSALTLSMNTISCLNLGANMDAAVVTSTGSWNFDDVAINDNSGSFQNSYPGDGKIIHLRPNATGDANAFAFQNGGTAGSANNFTRVNEVPPDDAATRNGSATLNDEDLFNCDDSGIGAGDTVNLVAVGGRFSDNTADATAAFKLEIEKTSAGTITQSAAIIPNSTTWFTNAPADPKNYPITLYQDPDGSNWTQTTLDSMQIGYKVTAAGVNRIQLTNVWALVDYTPNAAAPAINFITYRPPWRS